jgi:hypothetical protein
VHILYSWRHETTFLEMASNCFLGFCGVNF